MIDPKKKQKAQPKQKPWSTNDYDIDAGAKLMNDILQRYQTYGIPVAPEDAAAMAGSSLYESNVKPYLYQGQSISDTVSVPRSTGAVGLWGWDDRRPKLMAMKNPLSYETQLDYFDQENRGPEKKNFQRVLAAPDLRTKSDVFATKWERSGKPALDRRFQLSQAALNRYNEKYAKKPEKGTKQTLLAPIPAQQSVWQQFLDYIGFP